MCDCFERIDCPKAGELGHLFCGRMECGCPKFTGCLNVSHNTSTTSYQGKMIKGFCYYCGAPTKPGDLECYDENECSEHMQLSAKNW